MSIAIRVDCSSIIGSVIYALHKIKQVFKRNEKNFFIVSKSDYSSEIKKLITNENFKLILINNQNEKFSYINDAESTIEILKKKNSDINS